MGEKDERKKKRGSRTMVHRRREREKGLLTTEF